MKNNSLLVAVFIIACSLALYFVACRKEQTETTDNPAREPSAEMVFDRTTLEKLLNADAKVAGLCFLPKTGDPTQLVARPYYWEDDNLKPLKMAENDIPTANGIRLPDNNQAGRFMFELSYIPKNEVERLLFYTGKSSNAPIEGLRVKSIYMQQPEKIFSGTLHDYQTLMCMPYRKDAAFGEKIGRDREAVGYYVAPTCPPYWQI